MVGTRRLLNPSANQMNSAERRRALHRLHAAKLIHARLLGCDVSALKERTRMNVHWLQVLINLRTKR